MVAKLIKHAAAKRTTVVKKQTQKPAAQKSVVKGSVRCRSHSYGEVYRGYHAYTASGYLDIFMW